MIDRGRQNVLGILVDAVDYEAALERVIAAARARVPLAATALAVHGVMCGVLDAKQRYRLNHLGLVAPDGQPVRWALNLLHRTRLRERVYGPELMLRICQRAADEGLPIFLFGSRDEVLQKLQANLQARFPGLIVAGCLPSRFRRLDGAERQALAQQIRQSGAAITFVGLGCPRQEIWAYENVEALSMPVIAVGAAFDFHAGLLSQAPPWMQRRGLEWLFRLYAEPRRLWRRYLLLNPAYVALLLCQLAHWRRFDPQKTQPPSEPEGYG